MTYLLKPGLHSYNVEGRKPASQSTPINRLQLVLLVVSLCCLSYVAYTWANEKVYQATVSEAFDNRSVAPTLDGSVVGRVSVGRLNLSAMIREGVGEDTLKEAVGHLPSSAMPGQTGNFAIAAHRDTLFRGLKDIRIGDEVTVQTQKGLFPYRVVSTQIVKPTDVSVLNPQGKEKMLTMITCYPFYYVGSAPKRFIVQAKLIEPMLY